MEVKIITDVTDEPVTLEELKAFCQVDDDYAVTEGRLLMFMKAAREVLEKELNLSLATKTLQWQWDGSEAEIPYGPIQSITSLNSVVDPDTLITDYAISGLDFKRIGMPYFNDCYIIYPVGYNETYGAFNMTYVAGYEVLPSALKTAIQMQVDIWLKNQGMPMDELSPDVFKIASKFSRNLFIQ